MGSPGVDEQALHRGAGLGVQCTERLVHHHRAWRASQPAGQLDALAHAAGQALGQIVFEAGQPDVGDPAQRLVTAPLARQPRELARASSTLDRTVRHGSSALSWNTIARSREVVVMRASSARISARVGMQ